MKKNLLFSIFALASILVVNAQTTTKTNPEKFQPNWYLGMYTGANWFYGESSEPFKTSFRNNGSPLSSLALGYEFNPVIGIRGQIGWARYQWTNWNHYHYINWGANLTGDFMVNLSNWWAGYNPNRVFDVQWFAGVGLGYRTQGDYPSSLVTPLLRTGFQGNFHVTKQFDINLDLATNMTSDKMNNVVYGFPFDDFTSFQIGFTYHFKHIGEKQTAKAEAVQPVVQIKEVIKHDTVIVKEQPTPITKMVTKEFNKNVFFPIGVSKITDYNQEQTIEEAANFLKQYPNAHLQIDGYADKDTGGKARNMELSQHRAQNIATDLVKKYGIDPSRITAVGHGTVPQIFQIDPKNRVSTLKASAQITETSYQ
jgi:outer membrane protein OmpA-like peptidoglycan-associated protein